MPGPQCTVCKHPAIASIEQAIVGGVRHQQIAEIFNLSRPAIRRHMLNHMSAALQERIKKKKEDREREREKRIARGSGRTPRGPARSKAVRQAVDEAVKQRLQQADRPTVRITELRPKYKPGLPNKALTIDELIQDAIALREVGMDAIDAAQHDGDQRGVLTALKETRDCLRFCWDLCEAAANMPVQADIIDVINSPDWRRLEAAVLGALEDHPEIKGMVATKLLEVLDEGRQ